MATGKAASVARRSTARTSSSSGRTASSPSKSVNYTFDSRKESASQYNSRVAQERGDSSSSLASMQRATSNAYNKRGFDGGKVNGGVITSADLAQTGKIALPPPAVPQVPDIAANNIGFTDPNTGVTAGPNGTLSVTDPNDKYAGAKGIQNDFQIALDRLNMDAPSAADVQRQLEKDTKLRQKQQAVQDYTAQLNTIVANRDANKLRVEGQGRGIPDVIIGGQQAQIDKEAAIAALPVQAQLAAAQGNLALAQDHINTWGQILMKDAEAQYTRKKEVLTSVRDFAVGLEFKRIDDLDAANERKYQEAQALTTAKTNALSMALGQGAPASIMNAIKSATTREEVAAATGIYNGDVLGQQIKREQLNAMRTPTGTGNTVVANGVALKEVTDKEIQDVNRAKIETDSALAIIDDMVQSIDKKGSYVMWGADKGTRTSNKTNLLLAMKAIAGTGALDQGTIDVLAGTIPENSMLASDAGQKAQLNTLRNTLSSKTNEFINSYRGTTAEIDPRTNRIFQSSDTRLAPDEQMELSKILGNTGTANSTAAVGFDPLSYYND